MYFLSRVGTWLGLPFHSSQRLSKTFTSCVNGIFTCRPGAEMAWPIGSPNCVITTCSCSDTV